jgi:hypothetical protein
MKCIQAIRQTKEHSVGEILRVDDKTAFNMVGSYWKYISKSEWKSTKTTKSGPSSDQVKTDKKDNPKQINSDSSDEPSVKKRKKNGSTK